MSKEQNRAFIRGRQVRLDAERLLLVEKTKASILGAVSVGWKNRMGKVVFKQASMALRGGTALFDICRDGNKLYSVAVPLEGSDFIMESSNVIQFRTHEGTNYLWVRFEEQEVLKEWLTGLLAATKSEVSLNDFTIIRAVGKGGMGKVFFAKHKRTDERLALKVIDKRSVFTREGHLQHMVDERLLLEMGADHPFVLKLRYAFQTESNFFLATEFCEGGDLYHLLKRRRKTLSEDAARLISSEVILALESMHAKGCVYRDLKPDNVLLDSEGHVRLADFGLAKILKGTPDRYERTNSFCGTAQYTPPEMVQKKYYTQSVDLWCLGVFLYEVIEGSTPFYNRERDRMYQRIERESVKFSSRFSESSKDLISKLLEKNPKYRYTLPQVKDHKFYENVDWVKVKNKEFWPKGVYTSKERKEVAMEDLRIINTDRYKNLSVDEEEVTKGILKFKLGTKKQPTLVVPGFTYTSPEIVEKERRDVEDQARFGSASSGSRSNSGHYSTAEENARRIMEQAARGRQTSTRNRSFRPRTVRSLRSLRRESSNTRSKGLNDLRERSESASTKGPGRVSERFKSLRIGSMRGQLKKDSSVRSNNDSQVGGLFL